MSTYANIIRLTRGYGARGIATCHVAHVKAYYGLTTNRAPNRIDPTARVKPCPPGKWHFIVRALRELGLLK